MTSFSYVEWKSLNEESEEIHTGMLDHKELKKHIGEGAFKSILKHPFFHQHVLIKQPGEKQGFRYHKDKHGFERVDAANSRSFTFKDKKVKTMVSFDMKHGGRSVTNAHLFHNYDGERFRPEDGGSLIWHHIKSHHGEGR